MPINELERGLVYILFAFGLIGVLALLNALQKAIWKCIRTSLCSGSPTVLDIALTPNDSSDSPA